MATIARVNAKSIPWLMHIWDRVIGSEFYLASDENLRAAPSDVLDGWAAPRDVADLVRRRILFVTRYAKEDQTSLSSVTWDFTDRGIAIMRAWLAGKPAIVAETPPPDNCCPHCGSPIARATHTGAGE